jgi:hypothetical protein
MAKKRDLKFAVVLAALALLPISNAYAADEAFAQTAKKPISKKFDADKEFKWNSVMEESSENYSMIETDERLPDGRRVPNFLALKRKDGIIVVVSPDDKGFQEGKEKVGQSFALDLNRFTSEKEYQAAFKKLWDIFVKKLLEKSKAQYSQIIAKQRAIITPRKAGEWIVPGVISLYCESNGKTYACLVNEKGFIKPTGIHTLDEDYLKRYSVVKVMMEELNERPRPVIITMKQFPIFTFWELRKDGIFRDISQTGEVQDLIKDIREEQEKLCEICKSRSYVLKSPNDPTVYRKTADDELIPLRDPSSDPEWMRLTGKARESYKAIGGDLIKLIKSEVPWPTTEISPPTTQPPP